MNIEKFIKGDMNIRVRFNEEGGMELNLKDVCIGLGLTQIKNGKKYFRFERINKYLNEVRFIDSPSLGKVEDLEKTWILESYFYKLSMKADKGHALIFQDWIAFDVIPSIRKNNFYINKDNISKEQIDNLLLEIKKLTISKNMLHEITYDMADATTMSFTEASKKLFGKNAKYLKNILIEHGFIDKNNNIIIGEAKFKTPKGDMEVIRIFTKTNIERARKENDIRYCKLTNFGYMYLKKYFNIRGLSDFNF